MDFFLYFMLGAILFVCSSMLVAVFIKWLFIKSPASWEDGFVTRDEFQAAMGKIKTDMATRLEDMNTYLHTTKHDLKVDMDVIYKKLLVLVAFEEARNPTLAATMKGE